MEDIANKDLCDRYDIVSFRINYLLGKTKLEGLSKFEKIELMLLLQYNQKLRGPHK